MPALNIELTADELAQVRARAARKGVSMRKHTHDALVSDATEDVRAGAIAAAIARVEAASHPLLERLAER